MAIPSLSILIPTYNRSVTVRQTLDSIAGQTGLPSQDIEVIVSNDCSRDDTRAVLEEYAARLPYLRIFHQEANLNTRNWAFALGQARGQFVFVLCDDDAVAPDFVETYLRAFRSDPELDMVFGDIQLRDPDFQLLTDMPLKDSPEGLADGLTRCRCQLLSHHMVMSTMYRRSILLDAGGWDPQVGTHFDCTAFCRSALRARRTLRIPRPMLYFRLSRGSWSHQLSTQNQAQLAAWYCRKLDLLAEDAARLAPGYLPELKVMSRTHVRIVLAYLEGEYAHGRLSGPSLRNAARGLLTAFPDSRNDRQVWKVLACSFMGTGWLKAVRKVLGRPDPYASTVSLFNCFPDQERPPA
jgi:hypothetical protein